MAEAFVGTLAFAASAGVATFFAPCAYPLLPGYVGYYLSRDDATTGGAAVRGLAATLGALVVLAGVALLLVTVGHPLVAHVALLEPVVGLLLVGLGVAILTGRSPSVHVVLPERRASVGGFALFGAVYAVAAAGCVVPVVLGVVTQALALAPAHAAVALAAYAAAVSLPLAGVTLLAAAGSDALRDANRYVSHVQTAAAVVMIGAGVWQVALSLSYLGVV